MVIAISVLLWASAAMAADLLMGQGESRVLPVQHLDRIAVAEPDIADVLVVDSNEVLVTAKALGKTTLHLWEKSGRSSYSLRVVTDKQDLAEQLQRLIALDGVTVRIVEDAVIVDGVVKSEADRQRAVRAAAAYEDQVIDLLTIQGETTANAASQAQAAIGLPTVKVRQMRDTLVLQGVVDHPRLLQQAEAIAQIFSDKVLTLIELQQDQVPEDRSGSESDRDQGEQQRQRDAAEREAAERKAAEQEAAERLTQLRELIAEPKIRVQQVGKSVVLEGTVATEYRRRRALSLAQAFEVDTVDLLVVAEATDPDDAQLASAARGEKATADTSVAAKATLTLAELQETIGIDTISLRMISDVLFIEGTVKSPAQGKKAEAIVAAAGYKYQSFLEVTSYEPEVEPKAQEVLQLSEVAAQTAEIAAEPAIDVYPVNNSALFLEGIVDSEAAYIRVDKIARALVPDGIEVVNLIEVSPAVAAVAPSLVYREQPPQESQLQETQTNTGGSSAESEAEDAAVVQRRLEQRIAAVIPYPGVDAAVIEGAIVLQGQVLREEDAVGAERLAGLFGLPVVNLLSYTPAEPARASVAQQLKKLLQHDQVQVTEVGDRLLIEGEVKTQLDYARVEQIASLFSTDVVNLLKVSEPQQVLIQVQAVEANRVATSKLGITWGNKDALFTPHIAYIGQFERLGSLEFMSQLAGEIEVLADDGDAKLLANPTLLTKSGHSASFLAGGEIPVVIPKGDNLAVEWKEYGVKLQVTPEVTLSGDVKVTLRPEVSTLDWANAIRLNAITIPAMKTRRTETTVELKDGGTLALGGLIQNDESKQVKKVPLLGDIPILGALFRSEEFKREETELIFLITVRVISGSADQLAASGLSLLEKTKLLSGTSFDRSTESDQVDPMLQEGGPEDE